MKQLELIKEYKAEVSKKESEIEVLQKTVGKITIERDWLERKLQSLDSSKKKLFVDPELKILSISRQCILLGVDRSHVYYKPKENIFKADIINKIKTIFDKYLFMALRKFSGVCCNTVSKYRTELGLNTIIAIKQIWF